MIYIFLAALSTTVPHADTTTVARAAQGIDYRIEARLDETTGVLRGLAELRYTNHATSGLDTLWFHQHLNAFRPESGWARRELGLGVRRFQDLGPDEHAFERLLSISVDGRPLSPVYPLSPDSTVVGLPLASSLPPGETAVVRMEWDARLSTLPRRQGRDGRHYDFAQWYPRIAVYDENGWHTQPLLPQGEFFGEFGRYDVTIEVAADQVIGATGVPVEGDPGWAARARPGFDRILENRDFYPVPAAESLGLLTAAVPTGRKRVRWLAEEVHHFAWSANPEFFYEGASVARTGTAGGEIGVHVLYWPADEAWANGTALNRTVRALEWLQELFGPYPWPQLTNLHRIEPGGTEFPMMMMNGSPGEGLIVHEGAHQYLHGVLANNEFDDGWLDEGFASFITNWYWEESGVEPAELWAQSMNGIRGFEAAGQAQPIAIPSAEFRDPNTYSAMTYTKASLVFRMLKWLIGEEAMREVLRTLYDRHALQHLDEQDLRRAVSDVAGEELDWFFDQWLHTTDRLDYSVTSATTTRASDGVWTTRVEIQRSGNAWMPVTLRVGELDQRLESRERIQLVEVRTATRPEVVVLDPEEMLIDVAPGNNARSVEGS